MNRSRMKRIVCLMMVCLMILTISSESSALIRVDKGWEADQPGYFMTLEEGRVLRTGIRSTQAELSIYKGKTSSLQEALESLELELNHKTKTSWWGGFWKGVLVTGATYGLYEIFN